MDDHHDDNDAWVPPPHDDMDLDGEDVDDDDEDDDDDSDDDQEDDDEEDVDEDEVRAIPDAAGFQNFAMFDGGIADEDESGDTKARGKAADGEIVREKSLQRLLSHNNDLPQQSFYFICSEAILPDHPILKGGTAVQIGMKKQSFLNVVFRRFFKFCKEKSSMELSPRDLEFVHSTILNGDDNAEGAALMKNDHIRVRREQEEDRCLSAKTARETRESERTYFSQLNRMKHRADFEDAGDIVLSCEGPNGLVSCNSFMIRIRCPWLWRLVEDSRKQQSGRQSVLTLPCHTTEDGILVAQQHAPDKVGESSFAAHIESDEDEEMGEPIEYRSTRLWVPVPYSAPAVRILLEYIYTNRVTSLGLEAFSKSCKKQSVYKKNEGPVPPFTLRHAKWPNDGQPSVEFKDALDAVTLAHVAGFPRLALMCDVAASCLVTFDNVVDALVACENVEKTFGTPMTHVRKVAIRLVIQTDYDLDGGVGSFLKYAIKEKGELLVPTLLSGTNELIEASREEQRSKTSAQSPISLSSRSITPRAKRDWKSTVYANVDKIDKADAQERARERKKRRKTKQTDDFSEDDSWAVRSTQALAVNRMQKIWQHAKGRGTRPITKKIARKTLRHQRRNGRT